MNNNKNNLELKHLWTILCSNSSIDQKTNNLSIFNIIEQIEVESKDKKSIDAEGKKAVGINLELISMWHRKIGTKSEYEERVDFVDPKGETLNFKEVPFKFPDNIDGFRMNFKIDLLIFNKIGEYKFKVSVRESGKKDFTEVFDLPLKITVK